MSEKFTYGNDDDRAPPYEEAITSPNSSISDGKSALRSPLQIQRTEKRARRTQSLIIDIIEPSLQPQLLEGISKPIFLILPSDVLTQHPHLTSKDVVGLSDSANISVIRLQGDENRATFWHQSGVVQDVANSLRARLAASGHQVENGNESIPSPSTTTDPAAAGAETSSHQIRQQQPQGQQQKRTSPSWLKKQFGIPEPDHDPTSTTDYKLGWRADDEDDQDSSRRKLDVDEVRVLVKSRDVSFRFETEMGLLDSATARVLWVQVEMGT